MRAGSRLAIFYIWVLNFEGDALTRYPMIYNGHVLWDMYICDTKVGCCAAFDTMAQGVRNRTTPQGSTT